jgi:hypothetical protein
MIHLVFHHAQPVAAYESASDAVNAVLELPGWADPDLCIVSVPMGANLVATDGHVSAVPAGERRVSGAAGPGLVTLSSNGNKCP